MLADIIPTHQVATWLLGSIDQLLDNLGLSKSHTIEEIIYVAVIVAVAFFVSWLLGKLILVGTRKLVKWHHTSIGDDLIQQHVISKCSHIIPPLIFLGLLPFAFQSQSLILHILEVLATLYTIVVTALAINAVLTFVWTRYDRHENTKNLPLKGILNVAKGVVWIIVTIVGLSVIFDKSPATLLAGIGVFATALMLVFKDTIMGLVASVQLTANNMLRRGDWIVADSHGINGEGEDVSLTTIKVRNWDNSISTIPPYSLVSDSFRNYQAMRDMGGRRVDRSILVDVNSIRFLSPEEMELLRQKGRLEGIAAEKIEHAINVQLLRYALEHFLTHDTRVNHKMLTMVRQMAPTATGLPLQLYFFTRCTGWKDYEHTLSDIMDHVYALTREFGITMFQSPAGTDLKSLK